MTILTIAIGCGVVSLTARDAVAQDGYALEFDGVDDFVEVPDPCNVAGPLTIEFWVRCDVADGNRIVSNRDAGNGYEIDINSSGFLRFTIDGSVKESVDLSDRIGSWMHVAVTWGGPGDGAIVVYVDGTEAATTAWDGSMTPGTGSLRIGSAAFDAYFFDGAIDEVRIFGAVLTPDAIAVWMNRRIGPDHPFYDDLVGAWSMEENGGQVIACEVGSPGLDGQLGADPGPDAADPTWIASGQVGVDRRSLSGVKALYR